MKKILTVSVAIIISHAAHAQSAPEPLIDRSLIFDIVNICGALSVVYIISNFILQFTKRYFDHRLRNKIIDLGTPEVIVAEVLRPTEKKNDRNFILQWIFVLTGIGTGITITNLTRPIGLHSLAIMAFCVAAGFLGYYLFTRRTEK